MKINLYAVGIIVRSTKTTRRNLAIPSMCYGRLFLVDRRLNRSCFPKISRKMISTESWTY